MTPTLQEALRVLEGAKLVHQVRTADGYWNDIPAASFGALDHLEYRILTATPPEHAQALAVVLEAVKDAERLRNALKTARDHIEMDELRISHCKDAAIIDAAIAASGEPK
jgi:hypothetical protein